jgi:hypothetical protein
MTPTSISHVRLGRLTAWSTRYFNAGRTLDLMRGELVEGLLLAFLGHSVRFPKESRDRKIFFMQGGLQVLPENAKTNQKHWKSKGFSLGPGAARPVTGRYPNCPRLASQRRFRPEIPVLRMLQGCTPK